MVPFESHNRYNKKTIEPYAISVISQSYDKTYASFYSPVDTDNFDYLSVDGTKALEISLVLTSNESEAYVDTGKWKARQGGNGVKAADDIKIKFTNCTAEENAKIYQLNKSFESNRKV